MKDIVTYNYILDLKKRKLDYFERANVIQKWIKLNNLSIRAFALKIAEPKSTIEDWLLYTKVTREEYDKMKKNGLSKTEIRKLLRKHKTLEPDKLKSKMNYTDLDLRINEAISNLKSHILYPKYSEHTVTSINELRNILNRIELHIEKKINKIPE